MYSYVKGHSHLSSFNTCSQWKTARLVKAVCMRRREGLPFKLTLYIQTHTHPYTYIHTLLFTLAIRFIKMLASLLLCCLSKRYRDAQAEQTDFPYMVCLGFTRCWDNLLFHREVTVQVPFSWSVLSGTKQTTWHLDFLFTGNTLKRGGGGKGFLQCV